LEGVPEPRPPSVLQLDLHRLGVLIAQHGDAEHVVRLVERVVAIAESRGVDRDERRTALRGDFLGEPALRARPKSPSQLRVGTVPEDRAITGRTDGELERERREQRRAERGEQQDLLFHRPSFAWRACTRGAIFSPSFTPIMAWVSSEMWLWPCGTWNSAAPSYSASSERLSSTSMPAAASW